MVIWVSTQGFAVSNCLITLYNPLSPYVLTWTRMVLHCIRGIRWHHDGLYLTFHMSYNATLMGCKTQEISSLFPTIIVWWWQSWDHKMPQFPNFVIMIVNVKSCKNICSDITQATHTYPRSRYLRFLPPLSAVKVIERAKGLYNLGNAGGTWMLRRFHCGRYLRYFQQILTLRAGFFIFELLLQRESARNIEDIKFARNS